MFTKNIKDTFTANLLNAVSGVLGEANKKKQCSEGCECEACEPEETKEGYVPTNDMPSASDRKTAGKLAALLKRERDAKEKKEPLGVKTEEVEDLDEKRGLWDNIHAKRKRIKAGSGERMRKPGSEGAPSAADLKASANEAFEQIDESAKVVAHLIKRYGDNVRKSHVVSAANDFGIDASKLAKAVRTKLGKTTLAEDEQIDEISKATMGRYINKAKDSIDTASYRQGHKEAHGSSSKPLEKKLTKRHKGIETAVKKLTKEESEQIDEISDKTKLGYVAKATKNIPQLQGKKGHIARGTYDWRTTDDEYAAARGKTSALDKKIANRKQGIATAVGKLTKEESEQIDELSKATMGRYINKAATKMGSQGVTAGLKIAADEKSSKNFKDMGKREKGIKLAVNKLTKEEQDFIDSLNDADLEQIDELSKKTLGSYIKKASGAEKPKNVMDPKNVPLTKIAAYQGDSETGHFGSRFNQATYDKAERLHKNRSQGITRAADKLAKEEVEIDEGVTNPEIKKAYADLLKTPGGSSERKAAVRHYKSLRQNAVKEEVELDEARGRPKKAGARDFTIHPKTKEKLMHNNPEHVKRIERLQKNGILPKPKTEANQHIIQQLQRAKTSMRGGETINFTHGDSKHVAGTHAAKLLDKYAGMRPNEKEAFQKKIGHSHENLKSEL
jgi:hypothetical protein